MRAGNRREGRVGEQAVAAFGEGRPRFDLHALARHELLVGEALEEGVGFNLVDRRNDAVEGNEVGQPVVVEVGHTDSTDAAFVV